MIKDQKVCDCVSAAREWREYSINENERGSVMLEVLAILGAIIICRYLLFMVVFGAVAILVRVFSVNRDKEFGLGEDEG